MDSDSHFDGFRSISDANIADTHGGGEIRMFLPGIMPGRRFGSQNAALFMLDGRFEVFGSLKSDDEVDRAQ